MFPHWIRPLLGMKSSRVARRLAAHPVRPRAIKPQLLTLEDRTNPVTISIADLSDLETNASKLFTFTVSLDAPAPVGGVTVDYATTPGTAAGSGDDFDDAAGTVTIAEGVSSGTFTVNVNGDTVVEADETFSVTLSNPTGTGAVIGTGTATGTIVNDDSTTLSFTNVSQAEGAGNQTFVVTSSNAVQGGFTVNYASANGTATLADNDYASATGTLTFAGTAGETQNFTVTINNDGKVEGDETFTTSLNTVGGLVGGVSAAKIIITATGTGTLVNDDSTVLTIADVSTNEAAGTQTFTVTLSNAVQGGFTVNYATANGTATTADNDYVAKTGTLTFAGTAGETQTFTVTINDDNKVEADETYTTSLNTVGALLGGITPSSFDITDTGTGTIVNDDNAKFAITASSAIEGAPVVFTITLSNPVDVTTSVTVTTADGTANSSDYTALVGQTITFNAGVVSKTVSVNTTTDANLEPDETFSITLGGLVTGGRPTVTIDPANTTATGTILNDDVATLTINDVSTNEAAGTQTFTVTLDVAVAGGFTVNYATANGTATLADNDYANATGTLTFTGTAGETQQFTVTINDDNKVEGNETYTTSLNTVGGLVGGITPSSFVITDTGTGTLVNDDSTALTIADVSTNEAAGTQTFTVTLSNAVQGGFTVKYATANGTATLADNDYANATGTLTFAGTAGETQQFTVTINDDNKVEADETYTVSLNTLGALVGGVQASKFDITDTATGTIVNDDSAKFAITASSETEGGPVVFTITLSNPVDVTTSVTVTTADGTALLSNNDYTALVGQLVTFNAGIVSQTVSVNTTADNTVEADETFSITLGGLNNNGRPTVTIDPAKTTAIGTIVNDDQAIVNLTGVTVAEDGTLTFSVTLSNPVDIAVSVSFDTLISGTATAGLDFTAIAGQLVTFAANDNTTQIVTITQTDDQRLEGSETLNAKISALSAPARNVILQGMGAQVLATSTITDTESATLQFDTATQSNLEDNVTLNVNAKLVVVSNTGTGTLGIDRNIVARISDGLTGTATLGKDYTFTSPVDLTFLAGTNGGMLTKTTTITIIEDLLNEIPDETIILGVAIQGSNLNGQVTLGTQTTQTITILNDDATVFTYDATVGGNYRLVRNGTTVELYLGNTLVAVDNSNANGIVVNGTNMNDSLTIDLSGGNPFPIAGIAFNGNGQSSSPGDTLIIANGAFTTVTSNYTNTNDGNIVFAGFGTVFYTGLEPIDMSGSTLADLIFNLPAAGSKALLSTAPGGAVFSSTDAIPTFEMTTFTNPTSSLTINRGNATDTLTISAVPNLNSKITVGATAKPFTDILVSGALASNSTITFYANTIELNAPTSAITGIQLVAGFAATQTAKLTTGLLQLGEAGNTGNYDLRNGGNDAAQLVGITGNANNTILYLDSNDLELVGASVAKNFSIESKAKLSVSGSTTIANTLFLLGATGFSSSGTTTGGTTQIVATAGNVQTNLTNGTTSVAIAASNGAVILGGATASSAGTVSVSATKSITVNADISAATGLTLTTGPDTGIDGDQDIGIASGKTLTAANIVVNASDSLFANGAIFVATGTVIINVDTGAAVDTLGGTVNLLGSNFTATAVGLNGNTGNDIFNVNGYASPVFIDGKGHTSGDTLNFDAQTKAVTATANSFDTTGKPVTYANIEIINLTNVGDFTLNGSILDNTLLVDRPAGATLRYILDGASAVQLSPSSFTFNGLAGKDTTKISLATGSPVPAGGFTFNGGADADVGLSIVGTGTEAILLNSNSAATARAGVLTLNTTDIINYSGFEPTSQVDLLSFSKVELALSKTDAAITINKGTDLVNQSGAPTLTIAGATIPQIGLRKNSNVFVYTNAGNSGADAITIAGGNVDHQNTNLTILATDDPVTVTGNLAVPGFLTISAKTITANNGAVLKSGTAQTLIATELKLAQANLAAGTQFLQSGGKVTLTGGAASVSAPTLVQFTGTVDGPGELTVFSAGLTRFDSSVGSLVPLAKLSTDGPGSTTLGGTQVVTAIGGTTFNDPVTFDKNLAITSNGGTIRFVQDVNPSTPGLSLNLGGVGATVIAQGGIGNLVRLGTLGVPTANDVTFQKSITADAINIAKASNISFAGIVNTTNSVIISNANSIVATAPWQIGNLLAIGTVANSITIGGNGGITAKTIDINTAKSLISFAPITLAGGVVDPALLLRNVTSSTFTAPVAVDLGIRVQNAANVTFSAPVQAKSARYDVISGNIIHNSTVNITNDFVAVTGNAINFNGATTIGNGLFLGTVASVGIANGAFNAKLVNGTKVGTFATANNSNVTITGSYFINTLGTGNFAGTTSIGNDFGVQNATTINNTNTFQAKTITLGTIGTLSSSGTISTAQGVSISKVTTATINAPLSVGAGLTIISSDTVALNAPTKAAAINFGTVNSLSTSASLSGTSLGIASAGTAIFNGPVNINNGLVVQKATSLTFNQPVNANTINFGTIDTLATGTNGTLTASSIDIANLNNGTLRGAVEAGTRFSVNTANSLVIPGTLAADVITFSNFGDLSSSASITARNQFVIGKADTVILSTVNAANDFIVFNATNVGLGGPVTAGNTVNIRNVGSISSSAQAPIQTGSLIVAQSTTANFGGTITAPAGLFIGTAGNLGFAGAVSAGPISIDTVSGLFSSAPINATSLRINNVANASLGAPVNVSGPVTIIGTGNITTSDLTSTAGVNIGNVNSFRVNGNLQAASFNLANAASSATFVGKVSTGGAFVLQNAGTVNFGGPITVDQFMVGTVGTLATSPAATLNARQANLFAVSNQAAFGGAVGLTDSLAVNFAQNLIFGNSLSANTVSLNVVDAFTSFGNLTANDSFSAQRLNNGQFNGPVQVTNTLGITNSTNIAFNSALTARTLSLTNAGKLTTAGPTTLGGNTLSIVSIDTLTLNGPTNVSGPIFIGTANNIFTNGDVTASRFVVSTVGNFASNGNLTIGNDFVLGKATNVQFSGGTLTTNSFLITDGTTITINAPVNVAGTLTIANAGNLIINAPVTATTIIQSNGTGVTTISPTGSLFARDSIALTTNSIVLGGNVTAVNQITLNPTKTGVNQSGGALVTPFLTLSGFGNFNLDQPNNLITGGNAGKSDLRIDTANGDVIVRDSGNVFIRYPNLSDTTIPALRVQNGSLTVRSGLDFDATDTTTVFDPTTDARNRFYANDLISVPNGAVQIDPGVNRLDGTSSTIITFLLDATAGQGVTIGRPTDNGAFDNKAKDTFEVRPLTGATLTINGNRPLVTDGQDFSPFDTLTPRFGNVGTQLTTSGPNNTNGIYTFPSEPTFKALNYTSIETTGTTQLEAFAVQTPPAAQLPGGYVVRVRAFNAGAATGGNTVSNISVALDGNVSVTNPFIVSPSQTSDTLPFSPPRIAFAKFNADAQPDLVIVNGAGDAPLVTVIDGSALLGSGAGNRINLQNPGSALLARFFAFEDTFRNGVTVAAADLNGDGRDELVFGTGPNYPGGPRVRILNLDTNVQNNQALDQATKIRTNSIPAQGLPAALSNDFRAYPDDPGFLGGINVAAGKLFGNDDVADVVIGAGVGGAPRVTLLNGASGARSDFFAFDANQRGGVLVDVGFSDGDGVADLITAPGANAAPVIRSFSFGNSAADKTLNFEFNAASVGTVLGTSIIPSQFPNTRGVGDLSFGGSVDGTGQNQAILFSTPRGETTRIMRFDPSTNSVVDFYQTLIDDPANAGIRGSLLISPDPTFLRDGGAVAGSAASST